MSASRHRAGGSSGPGRGASSAVLSLARTARTVRRTTPGLSTEQAVLAIGDIAEQASFVAHRMLGVRLDGWVVTGHQAVLELEGDCPEHPLVLGYDDGMRSALQVGRIGADGSWLRHRYVFSLAEVANAYESLIAAQPKAPRSERVASVSRADSAELQADCDAAGSP